MSELKLTFVFSLFVGVLAANGNFLGTIRNLWGSFQPQSTGGGGDSSSVVSGKSFSARGGYYDGGGGGPPPPGPDHYLMSGSSLFNQRGWGWNGWGDNDHGNLDLYSLLGGLSFASLLGATIIYLARINRSGRRRRSADGLSYLDDDEIDMNEDPSTKGLNIVELIDSFLENPAIFTGIDNGSSLNSSGIKKSSKIHLGPGVIPFNLDTKGHESTVH